MTDQNELPVLNSRLNYIAIPIELIACPFFTYKEKEVITEIIGLSDKYLSYGGCSRSNKSLAFRHRITPEKISNIITMANRLGFVTSREDIVHKSKSSIGSSQYSTQRKIIMTIPDEWKAMGDLYNEAFIRENEEVVEIFELIEKELRELNKTDISQEIVSEIILKQFTPYKNKNLPHLNEKGLASYKSNLNKSNKEKKDISPVVSFPDEFKTKRHIPEEKKIIYRKLSTRLKEILHNAKKLQSGARTADWPDYFRKLEKTFSIREIRRTLDWYEEHMGEEFVPVCYSAASFHDKFINLQDAIEREGGNKNKPSAKSKTRSSGAEVIKNKYEQFESWILDTETGKKFLKGSPEHKEWLKTKENQK